jgi:hypothetical protein
LALVRAGQKEEARHELGKAIGAATSNPALFRNVEVRALRELSRLD